MLTSEVRVAISSVFLNPSICFLEYRGREEGPIGKKIFQLANRPVCTQVLLTFIRRWTYIWVISETSLKCLFEACHQYSSQNLILKMFVGCLLYASPFAWVRRNVKLLETRKSHHYKWGAVQGANPKEANFHRARATHLRCCCFCARCCHISRSFLGEGNI